jgi:hypothetical protein
MCVCVCVCVCLCVAVRWVVSLEYGVISTVCSPRMSIVFLFDILHMLLIRSTVGIIQYAHAISRNKTESDTDFFMSWLSVSIFRDIILTFPVDAVNFTRTHIVLSFVTVTVLPLAPCLNVCLCVKQCKCLHVDWFAVNCLNVILLVLACVFIVYVYRLREHRTLPET